MSTNRKPRVFVVQDHPDYNITPAQKFGTLVCLTPRGDSAIYDHALQIMRHSLKEYTDRDFILPIGDPILIGAAIAIAATRNQGKVNVLKYQKQERDYALHKLTIWQDLISDEEYARHE